MVTLFMGLGLQPACAADTMVLEGLKTGADDYLIQPFDAEGIYPNKQHSIL